MARPTLAEARNLYIFRFTMEHVPQWGKTRRADGTYYAPQYRSDAEWYENTTFPGERGHSMGPDYCHSRNQTWPLGQSLTAPYTTRGIAP